MNYMTALGYETESEAVPHLSGPLTVHLMGKDIIRFHALIWPAMLMAVNLPLPKQDRRTRYDDKRWRSVE